MGFTKSPLNCLLLMKAAMMMRGSRRSPCLQRPLMKTASLCSRREFASPVTSPATTARGAVDAVEGLARVHIEDVSETVEGHEGQGFDGTEKFELGSGGCTV